MKRGFRKVLPLALSVSLIVNSMAGFPVFAASDESEYEQEFSMTLDDICDALEEAMDEGNLLDESKYRFSGAAAEEYEKLFEQNDMLYEITPAFEEDGDGDLTLKIFARLDDDQELENITATEETKLIFLLLNKTDEEQSANIWVDDGETGWITVVPVDQVDAAEGEEAEDIQDEEIVTLDILDDGQDEAAEPEEEEDSADDEGTDGETIEDEDVSVDEGSISEETITEKSEQEDEESEDEENEISEDGSSEEDPSEVEADDTSEDKNDSDDVEDDNSENEKDDSGEDSSENKDQSRKEEDESSEKDSSKDSSDQDKQESSNENSENDTKDSDETSNSGSKDAPEKEIALSVNNVNRLMASLNEPDDEEEDGLEDEEAVVLASASDADSEGYEINGEEYEAVIVNDSQSGVAFVTTFADLGMDYGIKVVTTSDELKNALNNASEEDIIQLGDDIELSSATYNFAEVSVPITLDLNYHEISLVHLTSAQSVFISTKSDIEIINGTFTGEVEKGTLSRRGIVLVADGSDSSINVTLKNVNISNFYRNNNNNATIVVTNGSLYLEDCTFKDNQAKAFYIKGGDEKNGSVSIKNCEFSENLPRTISNGFGFEIEYVDQVEITESIINGNKSAYDTTVSNSYYGGGFSISHANEIIIEDNLIQNNAIIGSGGGFAIRFADGPITITGNKISGNISTNYSSNSSQDGGGFSIELSGGDIEISNNTISENSTENNGGGAYIYGNTGNLDYKIIGSLSITGNTFDQNKAETGYGGGLYFEDPCSNHDIKDPSDLSGNTVTSNIAEYGGGMCLYGSDNDREIEIRSGKISGNEATDGGGIYVNDNSSSIVHLYNVLLAGNSAESYGGGIYAESMMYIYETRGFLAYDNSAESGATEYHVSPYASTVYPVHAMNGAMINWYDDSEKSVDLNRGQGGNSYPNGMNAEIDYTSIPEGWQTLEISGNTASENGGGIAAYSRMLLGEGLEMYLKVNKEWLDPDGNPMDYDDPRVPDKIHVELECIDNEEEIIELDQIYLNDDDNWSDTITWLPTRYESKSGDLYNFVWDFYEFTNSKYILSSETYESSITHDSTGNHDTENITLYNMIRQTEFFDVNSDAEDQTEGSEGEFGTAVSATTGNDIEFETSTIIPSLPDIDESISQYSLIFHEDLDDLINLIAMSYSVYLGDEIIPASYYRVTADCSDGCSLEVDVNLTALYEDGIISDNDMGQTTIMLVFYAVLDESAEAGSYTGTSWYEVQDSAFSNPVMYESEKNIVTISTYKISAAVTNSESGEAISGGVEVALYEEDGITPVMRSGQPVTATVGDDGVINLPGLAAGTYILVVTNIPDGYEYNGGSITVEVGEDSTDYVSEISFSITPLSDGNTSNPDVQTEPGPVEVGSLDIVITDKNGSNISGVVFEIFDSEGNSMGSYTSGSSGINISGLTVGTYTIRIINANGYTFPQSEYTFTVIDGESTPCNIQATNTKTTSGRRSSGGGGGGGSSGGSMLSLTASTGTWIFDGLLFVESDGTIPSNEYLIIDGEVYAFYTNGYAIDRSHTQYYTDEAIADQIYIPTATGTWYKCGWWYSYADGTYPRNGWAKLSYNGRSDWYYFDVDGWMVTGWLNWNGNTYYLYTEEDGTRGHMVTGWNLIDGIWYYFSEDGVLQRNSQTSDENIANIYGLG